MENIYNVLNNGKYKNIYKEENKTPLRCFKTAL